VTGIVVGTFAVSVWAYSIRAVKQDTFEDVDEEAKAMLSARTQHDQQLVGETLSEVSGAPAIANYSTPVVSTSAPRSTESRSSVPVLDQTAGRPVGVLAPLLEERYPRFLDPQRKTFVWGAPSVDHIGRLSEGKFKD